jgi:hypothetical protein
MEVQRQTTPLTELEMANALLEGHRAAFGTTPSADRLGVGWAQCALEHGRGKALYSFNFGNVTATKKWIDDGGDYYVMRVPPPDPPVLKFRAFASPSGGAADYWRILGGRYVSALRLFDAGKALDACYELSRLRYFTANADAYSRAVASLFDYWRKALAPKVDLAEPEDDGARSMLSAADIAAATAAWVDLAAELDLLRPTSRDKEG